MSHELRTPLTSIIGFSKLMGQRQDLPSEARHYTKCISDASEALLAVINDVLDFSKLEAGQVTLDARPLAVRPLLEEAARLIAIQAAAKGLAVKIEADPATPEEIIGDVARLRQVLLNFLSNAVKFTDHGSITIKTNYRSDADRPLLKVSVIDTGTGIRPEAVGRLFERFSQAEVSTNRSHGGTGLGLAISKSVIDLMDGRIGVETELGEGSCFWFEIPAAAASHDTAAAAEAAVPLEGLTLRVLLVDDTAINRELVKLMLEPFGFAIEEAAGGAEAVQAAVLRPFDIIFMDVRMPRVDGLEAARLIRETSPLNRATPILALTADVEPDNAAACLAAGMNDVIAKPILLDRLVAKILEWGVRDQKSNAAKLSRAASL
jgi:CheY-like chemotaxis protein